MQELWQKSTRTNEALYILDPALGEEEITALVEKFKGVVEANGTVSEIVSGASAVWLIPSTT